MAYTSAHFIAHTAPDGSVTTDRYVVAVDENDVEWSIPDPHEECQVGDWLRYIEEGGTIDPAVEVETQPAPEEDGT